MSEKNIDDETEESRNETIKVSNFVWRVQTNPLQHRNNSIGHVVIDVTSLKILKKIDENDISCHFETKKYVPKAWN